MYPHEFHHHEHDHGDWPKGLIGHLQAAHRHGFGGRARRGDVQPAILALLAEKDMHGYQIIQELSARSGGAWSPSPGSIYPTLQLLEDRGLVTSRQEEGKRVFALTEEGRARAAELPDQAPWQDMAGEAGSPALRIRQSMIGLAQAVAAVARTNTPERMERGAEILDEARKRLYAILAEDE
jgi:DNA-binding PadR family transcriptional regulator